MTAVISKEKGVFEHPPGSGVWWVLYYDGMKRHREKVGTKTNAKKVYSMRKAAIIEGRKIPPHERPITVAQMVDRYTQEVLSNNKSGQNLLRLARLWVAKIGQCRVDQVTPGDIERIKCQWALSLAGATCNRRLACLKMLFGKAVRDRLVQSNPVGSGRVKMMRESDPRDRFLSLAEEQFLLSHMDEQTALCARFALQTGLRVSEQLGLTWKAVNLANCSLVLQETKAGGRQEVLLNSAALEILEQIRQGSSSPWVWPSASGGPLSRHTLHGRFEAARLKAGLTDIVWHTFRHTFISRLVMLGVPVVTVQRLARHKTLTMTLRYSHLAPDHKTDALERLATLGKDHQTIQKGAAADE